MRLLPGSHLEPPMPHVDTYAEDNMLTRGQTILDVDESRAVNVELETGDAALFAYEIAHASHPNRSDDRRIAIVLRYMPPSARQTLADWDSAALVRGEDRYGHFEPEPEPARDLDPVAVAFHRKAEERQRQIYFRGTAWQDTRVSPRRGHRPVLIRPAPALRPDDPAGSVRANAGLPQGDLRNGGGAGGCGPPAGDLDRRAFPGLVRVLSFPAVEGALCRLLDDRRGVRRAGSGPGRVTRDRALARQIVRVHSNPVAGGPERRPAGSRRPSNRTILAPYPAQGREKS